MLTPETVVMLLGLALLGAFVGLVLFTPVEEERPVSYGSSLRVTCRAERSRFRGLHLLRQPRHR